MTNLIKQHFDGSEVRIIQENGEPLFCAKDVCDVLGYKNSNDAITKHCREGGIAKRDTPTSSGSQEMAYINEGNLYRLIAKSKLPAAEKFESWVFDEVLPSIRKNGHYGKDPMELLADPEAMRGLLLTYSEKVLALESKVKEDAPKVTFYDNFANTDGLYNLQNAARALGKQPNLFIRKLKEKYLFYQGQALVPYIQFRQRGLFDVKVTVVDDKQRAQTYITPKGLKFFAENTDDTAVA